MHEAIIEAKYVSAAPAPWRSVKYALRDDEARLVACQIMKAGGAHHIFAASFIARQWRAPAELTAAFGGTPMKCNHRVLKREMKMRHQCVVVTAVSSAACGNHVERDTGIYVWRRLILDRHRRGERSVNMWWGMGGALLL